MKASILAIGTELTTGQILNKNAMTLSEKLQGYGIQIHAHLTVPDDRKLIYDSMNFLATNCDLLFITGGLGPTSDDFTREVVADWTQQPLIFDESSWTHIQNRLTSRGFQVRDMQKQQCFYPKDSLILNNAQGTAHGFRIECKTEKSSLKPLQHIVVLPGPPREIESIWNDHLNLWISRLAENIEKKRIRSWDTLGLGESDVAYKVEEVLKLFPDLKNYEIGYRVHLPYVEVKIAYFESETKMLDPLIQALREKLQSITVATDFMDVAQKVAEKIKNSDFTFYDYLSNGFLHHRLQNFLKEVPSWSFKQSTQTEIPVDLFENEENFLVILPIDENQCLIQAQFSGRHLHKLIEAPMKSTLMSERRKQYFSEMALIEFLKL